MKITIHCNISHEVSNEYRSNISWLVTYFYFVQSFVKYKKVSKYKTKIKYEINKDT